MTPASQAHQLRRLASDCNEAARCVRIAVDSAWGLGRWEAAAELEAQAVEREDEAMRLNLEAAEIEAGLKLRAGLFAVAGEIGRGA